MEKTYCVYKHTCPNGKMYIGITSNIENRWGAMGIQYASCINLFYAIRKYGWINIKHEILHNNLCKEDAEKLEIEYIAKYKTTDPRYGYNMTSGGAGVLNHSGYRRVNQYTLDGKLVKTYNNIREATKEIGVADGVISSVCRKKKGHKTIKGFIFRYEGDSLDLDLLARPDCTSVFQIDENKNIINKFNSVAAAAREIHADGGSLSRAIKNHHKCRGYYWCKAEDYENWTISSAYRKPIYCMEIKEVYGCASIVQKKMGANKASIGISCRNEQKTAGGYHWKYLYDYVVKDGTIIPGAITLGLITEEEALKQLKERKNKEE